MKTCEEMTRNVLCRAEAYRNEKKQQKRVLLRLSATTAAVCLMVLTGIVYLENQTPTITPDSQRPNDQIRINLVEDVGLSGDRAKMNICLFVEDFVPMTREEANSYYGTNIFPTVPADLWEWPEQRHGIYRRNGGTGEVYFDGDILNYSNDDFTRNVNVELDLGQLPPVDVAFWDMLEEPSVINGVEVLLAYSQDSGYYYAAFMHRGVGFRVLTKGLSEAETVAVIASLLQG